MKTQSSGLPTDVHPTKLSMLPEDEAAEPPAEKMQTRDAMTEEVDEEPAKTSKVEETAKEPEKANLAQVTE